MKFKFFTVIAFLANLLNTNAQLVKGHELLNDERWYSASKAFAQSSEEESIFYKGYAEMRLENYEEASKTFNSIASKPFGKIGMGWLELNKGNDAVAKDFFQKAADETKNKNPRIFAAISQAIANSKTATKDASIEWAKKATDLAKTNADLRMIYGDAFLSTQDGGQAITQYEYAQQFNANSALPLAKIGKVYFQSRTFDMSKDYLQKALTKDPNNLLALNYMAQIYYKYKVYDTAKMYQQQILDLGDKNPEDEAMMANIYFQSKDYDGAINKIQEIIKGDNKYNYLNRLIGYSYFETGKYPEALEFLNKFLESQPKERILASDYEYLGNSILKSGGDNAAAINAFKKGYTINPNDIDGVKKIASIFKSMKMYDEAVDYYTKATLLPEASSQEYFELAGAYYAKKDFTNADAMYSKTIELAPTSAGTYYMRASARVAADPEQATSSAKEDYKKFIELTTDKVEKFKKQLEKAYLYLAKDALKNMNDKALGKQYLDKVIEFNPDNSEVQGLMEFTK